MSDCPARECGDPDCVCDPMAGVSDNRPQADTQSETVAHDDTLRDRIAAVLNGASTNTGIPLQPWYASGLADAVIAALGLERQDHYDPYCDHYRYVTDWIAPK